MALQVGHSSFTSIHCARHSSWNLWLQGVFITVTSPTSSSFSTELFTTSSWDGAD